MKFRALDAPIHPQRLAPRSSGLCRRLELIEERQVDVKASIEKYGLMRPPVVWAIPGAKSYAVLDGDRRIAALRLIGKDKDASVMCAVFSGDVLSAREISILAHIGMGGERETNHGDEIVGVLWLLENERFARQQDLADAVNRKQGWVSQAKMIRARLSDVAFDAMRDGLLSRNIARRWVSHAKGSLPDPADQEAALARFAAEGKSKRGRKPGVPAPWKTGRTGEAE